MSVVHTEEVKGRRPPTLQAVEREREMNDGDAVLLAAPAADFAGHIVFVTEAVHVSKTRGEEVEEGAGKRFEFWEIEEFVRVLLEETLARKGGRGGHFHDISCDDVI